MEVGFRYLIATLKPTPKLRPGEAKAKPTLEHPGALIQPLAGALGSVGEFGFRLTSHCAPQAKPSLLLKGCFSWEQQHQSRGGSSCARRGMLLPGSSRCTAGVSGVALTRTSGSPPKKRVQSISFPPRHGAGGGFAAEGDDQGASRI